MGSLRTLSKAVVLFGVLSCTAFAGKHKVKRAGGNRLARGLFQTYAAITGFSQVAGAGRTFSHILARPHDVTRRKGPFP